MVTISQIQRGFAAFVDNEIAVAFTGWQKAVIAGGAGLFASNFPNIVKMYSGHPIVRMLGLYDANAGAFNIDALYNAIVPKLGADKIPVTIPKIGTLRMGQQEIDSLMRYIKEA